jgi:hypothetical protein
MKVKKNWRNFKLNVSPRAINATREQVVAHLKEAFAANYLFLYEDTAWQ